MRAVIAVVAIVSIFIVLMSRRKEIQKEKK